MSSSQRGSLKETRHSIESCAYHLLTWRPFSSPDSPKPQSHPGPLSKRPCRSDRATSSFSIDAVLDMSKLTLFDDDTTTSKPSSISAVHRKWFARKRRRRVGSRSVSGRSCSVGAANTTCSDFPMAGVGTDSSGEMFGDGNWASDVSERNVNSSSGGKEKGSSVLESNGSSGGGGGGVERGGFGNECGGQGNESGYGSEPGYRGDAELGYDDEEEDDNQRVLFWGDEFGGILGFSFVGKLLVFLTLLPDC